MIKRALKSAEEIKAGRVDSIEYDEAEINRRLT